jgi:hypothetical protein
MTTTFMDILEIVAMEIPCSACGGTSCASMKKHVGPPRAEVALRIVEHVLMEAIW